MTKSIPAIAAFAATIALAGCATLEEEAVELTSDTYDAVLTGDNEVGGGDPDGYATAEVSITDEFEQICWEISNISGIGPATAAHIHAGAAGANGPPVFALSQTDEGDWEGCKSGSEWTQNRIAGNPSDFYVNVHTAEFPGGAIRGQLTN